MKYTLKMQEIKEWKINRNIAGAIWNWTDYCLQ